LFLVYTTKNTRGAYDVIFPMDWDYATNCFIGVKMKAKTGDLCWYYASTLDIRQSTNNKAGWVLKKPLPLAYPFVKIIAMRSELLQELACES
jgi:hypothetical protein